MMFAVLADTYVRAYLLRFRACALSKKEFVGILLLRAGETGGCKITVSHTHMDARIDWWHTKRPHDGCVTNAQVPRREEPTSGTPFFIIALC